MRDVRRHVGQLVIVGFDGVTVPPELRSFARQFDLGGIILFARNIEAPEQVAELSYDVQSLALELPLWVSIDQEGGRVARLRSPFTEWPPMITLGRSGDPALAARFARALAGELQTAGISLDYAPVLDVHTNPANPVIGDRALSEHAEKVAELGAVIIRTLQSEGIAACGKHFPGHGDTSVDSHLDLPIVDHPLERLRAIELAPFRAAIEADVAAIMTAHVLIPPLDEDRPATLSPRIVTGLLREELGYSGLVLSDDLDMRAISGRYTTSAATVAAIGAGCDGVLLCSPNPDAQAAAMEAVIYAIESEELPLKCVEEALARQRRTKERYLGGPRGRRAPSSAKSIRSEIGTEANLAVAAEMARYL